MADLDPKLQDVYDEVLGRNPGEQEFHQAVREVLESLAPVVSKHPEYVDAAIIRRLCEPGQPQASGVAFGAGFAAGVSLARCACTAASSKAAASRSTNVIAPVGQAGRQLPRPSQ